MNHTDHHLHTQKHAWPPLVVLPTHRHPKAPAAAKLTLTIRCVFSWAVASGSTGKFNPALLSSSKYCSAAAQTTHFPLELYSSAKEFRVTWGRWIHRDYKWCPAVGFLHTGCHVCWLKSCVAISCVRLYVCVDYITNASTGPTQSILPSIHSSSHATSFHFLPSPSGECLSKQRYVPVPL